MSRRISILVVDDEPRVLRFVRTELESDGYRVLAATNGRQAIELHETERPALVILDLIMPDMDGFEVLRRLRVTGQTPVIVLTARASDIDKIRGLDLGADDYLTKPFNPEELAARMRAVLRRTQSRGVLDEQQVYELGRVTVDLDRRQVLVQDDEVTLSPTEWKLLANLVTNAGRVILHEDLLGMTWGPEYRNDLQYLRVWVSRLRRKLGESSSQPSLIRTVPGVGYTLRAPGTDRPGSAEMTAHDDRGSPTRDAGAASVAATHDGLDMPDVDHTSSTDGEEPSRRALQPADALTASDADRSRVADTDRSRVAEVDCAGLH
ncbi:MAG: response regulator transcription factor [Chloroflexi bacterium]|nr:response regulator transcription factor [Chloroflexota bacterium]